MNKQCKKDAFYFYKLEFEKENIGKVFDRGITDIEVAARQSWRSMTLQQRDPYEDLAKQAAPIQKKPVDKDLLSQSLIDAENKKIVKEIVRQSVLSSTIQTKEYYLIAANIFCELAANKCLPAEIALLKFTLKDGVVRTYHTHINPETLPPGYKFTALEFSEKTHQLPLPPNAMGKNDFAVIQQEIDNFIGNAEACKQGFIPLFTLSENVRVVESVCEDLCSTSNVASNRRYKILSIDQLLFNLKARIGGNIGGAQGMQRLTQFKSIDEATNQLNREKYTFLCEIACEFHDEKDCSKYCCLSDVKRWAYVLSENLCLDLKISLVEGKHFPNGVETPVPQQLVKKNYSHNESKENTATVAAVHRVQNYNLNAEEENFSLNTGYRRPRNYFVEESRGRRNFDHRGRGNGRGRGRGRGITRYRM